MSRLKKILLLMLLLLVAAEILFEINVTDKNEMLLNQLKMQTEESIYRVDCGDCEEYIVPWSNEKGEKYLFLPSSAEGYQKIKDGIFEDDSEIIVMRSSNVASVFVTIKNDILYSVDENKEYLAPAYATIINANGDIEYAKDLEYIKVRGNGTYNTQKKPYEIKLMYANGLLGMDTAKEWILLANAYDSSLLKNSLVQDFAENYTDIPSAVNKPIDLYINGEYRGSYLLSEKVQVRDGYVEIIDLNKRNSTANGTTEITEYQQIVEDNISYVAGIENPKDITGGYLVEMVPEQLLDDSLSYFYTENGTLFKLKNPKYASKEEVEYIKGIFDELELAIATDDGINPQTGRHYSEIISVDSWVQKYLLELVFQNSDMSYASMYYYKDSDSVDSRLYAGMPWDYDLCLPNIRSTDAFPFYKQMYLRADLLRFEEVRNAFQHIYETMFVPYIEKGLDTYLAQKKEEIADSYNMNAIRWNEIGRTNNFTRGYFSLEANIDYLSLKMKASMDAMNKWIYEKDNYCVISFEDVYEYFLVEKGVKADFEPPIYANYINLFSGWKDSEDNLYSKEETVEKDIVYSISTVDLSAIFSASEPELWEMDFSNIAPELLEKIIIGLRKNKAGEESILEKPISTINASVSGEEVEIIFLKQDGTVLQTIYVPRGSKLKDIPVPDWEDGIFLKWKRYDNGEVLNENVYLLESAVYEADWIYVPYLIMNALAISEKSIDEIDIDLLERVFQKVRAQ